MNKKLYILLVFFLIISCHKKTPKITQTKLPVTIAVAKQQDVPIFIESIGHVDPLIKVEIRSRVEGQLESFHFKQGAMVKEGDLLFVIDPRSYLATLQKAQATLLENLALLALSKDTLKRNKPLYTKEYISEIDFDSLVTDVKKYEAIVDQNSADVENAKINLNYCYIKSPITGKVGILNIDKGNLITADGEQSLAVINQIQPIYVTFSVPEKYLLSIMKYKKENTLKVVTSFDDFKTQIEGTLNIVDNEIDEQSAMIRLRAIYNNEDCMLTAGQFVTTRVILTTKKDAITVPFQAVQITPKGPVVFIVKDDKVEMREVILGQRENLDIIIEKGVNKDEKVVTKGQINLIDGSLVFETKE